MYRQTGAIIWDDEGGDDTDFHVDWSDVSFTETDAEDNDVSGTVDVGSGVDYFCSVFDISMPE